MEILEVEDEEAGEGGAEDKESVLSSTVVQSIYQLGLKWIVDFFWSPVKFEFVPYVWVSFASFISPWISSLNEEDTQEPSSTLCTFCSWTMEDDHVKFFVDYDAHVLPKINKCLVALSIKPAVINCIFDIIDCLLAVSSVHEDVHNRIIKPYISLLLSNLAILVQDRKSVV